METLACLRFRIVGGWPRLKGVALKFAIVFFSAILVGQSLQAQTFTVLYNFAGLSGGEYPQAGLVRDNKGNLYGTTVLGAYPNCPLPPGCGSVFKLDPKGIETVLYNFTGGTDGGDPQTSLMLGPDGNLYGTTEYGGDLSCQAPFGCGTIFKLDRKGTETVIHSFAGTPDGLAPAGTLTPDGKGNFYGMTSTGGASGVGTVYKLNAKGEESVVYNFSGGALDGAEPISTSLVLRNGVFYGITAAGGTSSAGVVFKLNLNLPSAQLTVLHSFSYGTTDGSYPWGTPLMDDKGNIYGTASAGGLAGNGVVWMVTSSGKETVLHNFLGSPSDGSEPLAGLISDGKGHAYGLTVKGGSSNYGTLYELDRNGLQILHNFSFSMDGGNPFGTLIFEDGILYGTAYEGGEFGFGTVFQMTP